MGKKLVVIVALLLVIFVVGVPFIQDMQRKAATTFDMDFSPLPGEESGYEIGGIWDTDNTSKYKYIVIKPRFLVNTQNCEIVRIADNAFANYSTVEVVHIPSSVTSIGQNAFAGCSSLNKITYGGTKEQWTQMVIESGNDILNTVIMEYQVSVADYE